MSFSDVPSGKIAAVVTSLEMRQRPAPRPDVSNSAVALQHVARPELTWFRDLFRSVGESWIWVSRLAMPDAALAAIIHDPLVEIYVLKSGGPKPDCWNSISVPQANASWASLTDTGLRRPRRGPLADESRDRARVVTPIRRFWLHTCTFDHQDALAFYVRSGFRPFRLQIEFADDPRLSGLLPRTAAPHVPIIE